MPDKQLPVQFAVSPLVVFQLGRGLITDQIQALLELVKNAYDADATRVILKIVTSGKCEEEGTGFPDATGYIVVDDNGFGMDIETIKRGWLTVAFSPKREMKALRKTTPKGRTPVGDKGLGRLGAQRLGKNLEIFTVPTGSATEYHIAFSWEDFAKVDSFGDVNVTSDERPATRARGTRIIISGLHERQNITAKQVEAGLSKLISPSSPPTGFRIAGEVDGEQLELLNLTERLREAAHIRYRFDFNGTTLSIQGWVKMAFLRPTTAKKCRAFALRVEEDGGSGFAEYLLSKPCAKAWDIRTTGKEGWFLTCQYAEQLEGLGGQSLSDRATANPGPFSGELSSYSLTRTALNEHHAFDALDEYKKIVKECSGVRMFRDGFGVRVAEDYLGFGQQWTSGSSYYGLKPGSTIGSIAISARDNPQLAETTNREGFVDTPHYRSFLLLLSRLRWFTDQFQEFVRRGVNSYVSDKEAEQLAVPQNATPEDIGERMHRALEDVSQTLDVVASLRDDLQSELRSLDRAIAALDSEPFAHLRKRLADAGSAATAKANEIAGRLCEIAAAAQLGPLLQDKVKTIRDQQTLLLEAAGLGLVAEALSHETQNVADRLAEKTRLVRRHLRTKGIQDSSIDTFVEHVNTSVNTLRKQMAHLAPSLRVVREKKDVLRWPRITVRGCSTQA